MQEEEQIRALLDLIGLSEFTSIEKVTKGFEASIFRLENKQGTRLALKIYPLSGALSMTRESLVLQHLAAFSFIAPRVLKEGRWEKGFYLIEEWRKGEPLSAYLLSHPAEMQDVGYQFGQWQARLHTIPLPQEISTLLFWKPLIETPQLEAIQQQAVPDTLCHFDFHPGNILIEGGKIASILDFGVARQADRRADLGITQTLLDVGPLLFDVDPQILSSFIYGWRTGYQSEAGAFPLTPLFHTWAAYYVLNRSRRAFPPTAQTLRFLNRLDGYAKEQGHLYGIL